MTYNAYITLRNSDTVLFDLEEDYLRSDDGLIYIGNHYIVSASEFVSVEFVEQDEELTAEDDVDTSTDRVKEIADLVLEELTKSGKVKAYATGGLLPEPKPFGGSGIITNPNPIQPWNVPDTFETTKPIWVSNTGNQDVLREEPKTSLERAVEERRRGAY